MVLGLNPGPCACRASPPLTHTYSTCVDCSNHLCASHTLPDVLPLHLIRGLYFPTPLGPVPGLVNSCPQGSLCLYLSAVQDGALSEMGEGGSTFYSSLALAPCLPSTDALEIFAKLGANIRNVYTVLNAQDLAWHLKPLLPTVRQAALRPHLQRPAYWDQQTRPGQVPTPDPNTGPSK